MEATVKNTSKRISRVPGDIFHLAKRSFAPQMRELLVMGDDTSEYSAYEICNLDPVKFIFKSHRFDNLDEKKDYQTVGDMYELFDAFNNCKETRPELCPMYAKIPSWFYLEPLRISSDLASIIEGYIHALVADDEDSFFGSGLLSKAELNRLKVWSSFLLRHSKTSESLFNYLHRIEQKH